MKKLPGLAGCVLLLLVSVSLFAQQPEAAADTFKIGGRTIRVPAPEGFVDVYARYEWLRGRFTVGQPVGSTVYAGYTSASMLPQFDNAENPDFDLFAKFVVNDKVSTIDATPKLLAGAGNYVERHFDALLDPKGPVMKNLVKRSQEKLDDYWGQETGLDITKPQNLGVFDRRPNAFGLLSLMTIESFGRKQPVLGAVALVLVNQRIIYLSSFKLLKAESDPETLKTFAKKWTDAVIAANK